MSDDDALGLVDELAKLLEGSPASAIEVETDDLSVRVVRRAVAVPASAAERDAAPGAAVAEPEKVQRVRATTVGIFSAAKEWKRGDDVTKGTVLGAIQSLGHMADIAAPADGRILEILVAAGAPVEYGQPLFAIALA